MYVSFALLRWEEGAHGSGRVDQHDNRDFDIIPNYQPKGQPSYYKQTRLFSIDQEVSVSASCSLLKADILHAMQRNWLRTMMDMYVNALTHASNLDDTVEEKLLIGDRQRPNANTTDRPSLRNWPSEPLAEVHTSSLFPLPLHKTDIVRCVAHPRRSSSQRLQRRSFGVDEALSRPRPTTSRRRSRRGSEAGSSEGRSAFEGYRPRSCDEWEREEGPCGGAGCEGCSGVVECVL